MFDGSLPEMGALADLDAAALVEAAGGWARAENAACARKQAVMAEIFTRRTALSAGERESWWVDPEAAVAAELAAALGVTQSLAIHQTHRGVALRDRLPKVATLFEAGLISDMLVRTIVWRTYLIDDDDAMAAVDAELATRVRRWGRMSIAKTEHAIDALVDEFDPGALRRSRAAATSRTVEFGSPSDAPGVTSMWARLSVAGGALLRQRVDEMARSVCDDDARPLAERRAVALEALGARAELACACGQSSCAGATHAGPAKNAVVFVVADAATVDAARRDEPDDTDGGPDGPDDPPGGPPPPDVEPSSDAEPADAAATPAAQPKCTAPPAYVFGGGIVPAPLLAATLDRAGERTVVHPGVDGPSEPRYTPSRALADFVRCRDLTCRFPGCDKPATNCDLDHTVPYPVGPTNASNIKCLCRFHHLLKTFWCGPTGWQDRQLPDGTVVWTAPTEHTYTTYPGSRQFFPSLCAPTATLWTGDPPAIDAAGGRGVMMPRRRRTRAQNTARQIAVERKLNDELVAERNKPPPF